MKSTSIIVNSIYVLTIIFFLLDGFGLMEIKSDSFKTAVYFGLPVFSIILLFWNFFALKKIIYRLTGVLIPLIIFVFILSEITVTRLMFASSSWETEIILYQKNSFQRIEEQVKDVGALGYNHRTVYVTYITPIFMIVKDVPENIESDKAWKKVDIHLHEDEPRY